MIDQVSRLLAHEATDERLRQARAVQVVDGWDAIAAAGLPLALAPESAGGLGLDTASVLAIARAHGRVGAPWPLADAMIAAAPDCAAELWAPALAAAQIAGLAETVLAMTLEWTQTRQQFGKPLSKNQAVQHSLARMAAETAAAGAAVGLAGLGLARLGVAGESWPLVAAAKARASEAAGIVAALAHQLHGAIGVTSEHRLHLFTRALWQGRDAAGSEHDWHARLGAEVLARGSLWALASAEPLLDSAQTVAAGDRFRFPVVAETAARAALRADVRIFLAEELAALPPHVRAHSWNGHSSDFSRKLGARGWLGMTWPKALGGHERSALDRLVVIEELLAAGAPVAAHWIADRQTGPLLIKFGTPQQQAATLPAIARGEYFACIGMSESGAGSDLAALTTRARRVDGGWRVTGTKLWTTYAHKAHAMLLLCRTGDGQRHEGLSQLLVPMDSPGLGVRPIIDLMGEHHFNEVHFDDVFVPENALVGREGNGWAQVMSELAYERSGPERFLSTLVLAEEVVAALPADAAPAHAPIGRLAAHLMVLRLMARGLAALLEAGEDAGLEAAMVKDLGADFEQAIPEVARSLLPLIPNPPTSLLATLEATIQIAPMVSLRGGTREILRGIIARALGVR